MPKGICSNTGRTHFNKGFTPWNKGEKLAKEHRSINKICKICGNYFNAKQNCIKKGNAKYCSKKCFLKSWKNKPAWNKGKKMSEEYCRISSESHKGLASGSNNPMWKGGRRIRKDGYIVIYIPNHPRASRNMVTEHRLIMERHIGRYLTPKEIVHHLNGIKNDNRIENLAMCIRRTHHLFIKQLQERIAELENKKRKGAL